MMLTQEEKARIVLLADQFFRLRKPYVSLIGFVENIGKFYAFHLKANKLNIAIEFNKNFTRNKKNLIIN